MSVDLLFALAAMPVRFVHVAAAAIWFGATFRLLLIRDRLAAAHTAAGEIHLSFGGELFALRPSAEPSAWPAALPLRWSAYLTCIAGYLLLAERYWLEPVPWLIGPESFWPETWLAVVVAIAVPILGYGAYELLCFALAPLPEPLRALVWGGLLVLSGIALLAAFEPRAALIHLGVLVATCMAADVGHHIAPCEARLARAAAANNPPDPACLERMAMRSRHIAYAMPATLALMLAGHMPLALPPRWPALFLAGLVLAAFAVTDAVAHLRHRPSRARQAMAGIILGTALVLVACLPAGGTAGTAAPSLVGVQAVVEQRCATCHSSAAVGSSGAGPVGGIALDDRQVLAQNARAVAIAAGYGRSMPPGNVTGMQEAERELLRRWFEAGAPVD